MAQRDGELARLIVMYVCVFVYWVAIRNVCEAAEVCKQIFECWVGDAKVMGNMEQCHQEFSYVDISDNSSTKLYQHPVLSQYYTTP